jgi:hypothetical protein
MGRIFTIKPSQFEVEHWPAIRAAELYQAEHGDALPATPIWRALERRHDLNPARFDHWHPNLGIMIERMEQHDADDGGASVVVQEPPVLAALSVPEPSSLALWCVGLAVVLWVNRRGR